NEKERLPHECKQCGKKFLDKSRLRRHFNKHLEDIDKRLAHKCKYCDRKFSQLANKSIHERTHLANDDPQKKKYECTTCGKFLSAPHALQDHIKLVHAGNFIPKDDPRRIFECDVCGKIMSTPQSLKSHKMTHMEIEKQEKWRNIYQPPCIIQLYFSNNVYFIDKNDPKQEELKRPFKCDKCPGRFACKSNFTVRLAIHHNQEEKRPFQCEKCDKRFPDRSSLARHELLVHIDENDPQQAELKRPFNCDKCGQKFMTKQQAKMH
ncbi:hypothetical protein PMAYCL1PPCAC_08956, partial [Pristionchus mayeri]